MTKAFLIKYAEIGIKGKNRRSFEDALIRQIERCLLNVEGDYSVTKEYGRIYVFPEGSCDEKGAIEALQRVFGISGICPVQVVEDEGYEKLEEQIVAYMKENHSAPGQSFKVYVRRANKQYPIESMKLASDLGAAVLRAMPFLRVDVHEPDILLSLEVRSSIYIYSRELPGPGGMPVGTGGNAMLLLSGGIDSPVAGYMISRRGVQLDAVYFHAPPYTSERAKQKVVDLARQVALYSGPIRLHIVNFTDIQLMIYEKCPHEELTIIMRRYMMRIAELFAERDGAKALITGESIGQVASQTMDSLVCTNAVCTLPVFRPLIGMDKQDIVTWAEKIGTYETSILPFEDCCTIFVAKHPVTHPILSVIERSENALAGDIEEMVRKAVEDAEQILVG